MRSSNRGTLHLDLHENFSNPEQFEASMLVNLLLGSDSVTALIFKTSWFGSEGKLWIECNQKQQNLVVSKGILKHLNKGNTEKIIYKGQCIFITKRYSKILWVEEKLILKTW